MVNEFINNVFDLLDGVFVSGQAEPIWDAIITSAGYYDDFLHWIHPITFFIPGEILISWLSVILGFATCRLVISLYKLIPLT